MKFLGKWLIWIGGLALLFVDLRPLVLECLEAIRQRSALGPYTLEEWLLKFARPVFVMGVLCATALPELGARRKKKAKAAGAPAAAPAAAAPAAAGRAAPPPVSPEPQPPPAAAPGPDAADSGPARPAPV